MSSKSKSKSKLIEDLRSPWLLGIIGTVLVAIFANITLITFSFYYPHSLVAKDYYNKGKEYFHERAGHNNSAQRLGYNLKLGVAEQVMVNTETAIVFQIDHKGNKVSPGNATLFAYRVDDNTKDFQISLKRADNGHFLSNIKFLFPGTWDLIAQITVDGEKLDVAKRIFVHKVQK